MVPDATTAASGGALLYSQCAPFAILKPKNRKPQLILLNTISFWGTQTKTICPLHPHIIFDFSVFLWSNKLSYTSRGGKECLERNNNKKKLNAVE